MDLSLLTAISPVDGRYRTKTQAYAAYFSEYALIRYRVQVEIEYFIALCEIPLKQLEQVPNSIFPKLRDIYKTFSEADALKVKNIESVTNHDVKAVEYFIKDKFVTDYGLREMALIPVKNNSVDTDMAPSDVKFESVDQIVTDQLTNIDSKFYDPKLLLKIYQNL